MTIVLKKLCFERNSLTLLSGMDGIVKKGSVLRVSGINGSGKSTFLKILTGLIEPTEGQMLWEDQSIIHNKHYQSNVFYLSHDLGLKNHLTVSENIKLSCALLGSHAHQDDELLKYLNLTHKQNTLVMHLSAGQQKRTALACLLASQKTIWILDEPFSALDHPGQEAMKKQIEQHVKQGGIVVIADPSQQEYSPLSVSIEEYPVPHHSIESFKDFNFSKKIKAWYTFIAFDFLQTFRQSASWLTPLLFFLVVNCLFPVALSPDPIFLKTIGPGVIWVTALLSILISIGKLFGEELQTGFMEKILLSPLSLSSIVAIKIIHFWMVYCLPLILLTPLLAIFFNLSLFEQIHLMITLTLGTSVICCIGAIGAALTTAVNNNLLLPTILLPLYFPILIFGTQGSAMTSATSASVALLGAFLLICIAFTPFFTCAALRIGTNDHAD